MYTTIFLHQMHWGIQLSSSTILIFLHANQVLSLIKYNSFMASNFFHPSTIFDVIGRRRKYFSIQNLFEAENVMPLRKKFDRRKQL